MVRLLISDCSRYNKFPFKNCFSCIPFILVCWVFFFFSFIYFLVSIVISSLTHWVFRSVVSFPDIYFKWVFAVHGLSLVSVRGGKSATRETQLFWLLFAWYNLSHFLKLSTFYIFKYKVFLLQVASS